MNNKEMKELIKTKWKNNFNKEQLNQMLWGLEDNLDVSLYAKPEISIKKMIKIKEKLLRKKNSSSKFDFYRKQIISLFNF